MKEQVPSLQLDGAPKELDFPDLTRCTDIKSPENLFEGLNVDNDVTKMLKTDNDGAQLDHLQEELDNHKSKVLAKDSSISLLKNRIEGKEQEITQLRSQIEKLNKSMKDLSISHKMQIIFNEEKTAKKAKELDTILKDKKCKNCPICLEGMNHSHLD